MSYMSNKITEKLSRNAFWLSILLHILFVLFILIALLTKPEQEKKQLLPHYYVPAYTYTGSIKPSPAQQNSLSAQNIERSENTAAKTNNKSDDKPINKTD